MRLGGKGRGFNESRMMRHSGERINFGVRKKSTCGEGYIWGLEGKRYAL